MVQEAVEIKNNQHNLHFTLLSDILHIHLYA